MKATCDASRWHGRARRSKRAPRVLPAEEGEGRRKVEVTVRTTNDDGSEAAFTVVVPILPE